MILKRKNRASEVIPEDTMKNRTITLDTKTDIHRYNLKDDCIQMVRVRKGLYRIDERYMVAERGGDGESVYYGLGETQPKGSGTPIKSSNTMAHCRLMQTNGKKAGMISGFNMKYIPYLLIGFAVIYAVVFGGI